MPGGPSLRESRMRILAFLSIAILGYGWIDLMDTIVEDNSAAFAGGGAWPQSTGKLSCKATALGLAGIVANSSPAGGVTCTASTDSTCP